MKPVEIKIFNKTKNAVLAQRVRNCRNFFTRMVGLLGTHHLDPAEACWLVPCNQIHTLGMKYPIDVYFLNRDNRVVSIIKDMKPNRISPLVWKARSVVELSSGVERPCDIGDEIQWGGVS